MIVLGVDVGFAICGYGFVENERGQMKPLEYGVITTNAQALMQDRLLKIHVELNALIRTFKPEVIAIEKLYFGRNTTTAITVAQARGIILLAAAQNNIPVMDISPNEAKLAITGYGHASKEQMIYMVTKILNLSEPPTPDDAADALAIAVAAISQTDSIFSRNFL